MIAIKASRQAITFKVVVQPRSSKAAIVGTHLDGFDSPSNTKMSICKHSRHMLTERDSVITPECL
jgi:hypothetical protein